MAILKFVPSPKKIRDNRSNDNGYYEATCNSCGTLFFPKRSNAKYCTPKCAVDAHRTAVASGEKKIVIPKKEIAIPVEEVKTPVIVDVQKKHIATVSSRNEAISVIAKMNKKSRGLQTKLEALAEGKSVIWEGIEITRTSRMKYDLKE